MLHLIPCWHGLNWTDRIRAKPFFCEWKNWIYLHITYTSCCIRPTLFCVVGWCTCLVIILKLGHDSKTLMIGLKRLISGNTPASWEYILSLGVKHFTSAVLKMQSYWKLAYVSFLVFMQSLNQTTCQEPNAVCHAKWIESNMTSPPWGSHQSITGQQTHSHSNPLWT